MSLPFSHHWMWRCFGEIVEGGIRLWPPGSFSRDVVGRCPIRVGGVQEGCVDGLASGQPDPALVSETPIGLIKKDSTTLVLSGVVIIPCHQKSSLARAGGEYIWNLPTREAIR